MKELGIGTLTALIALIIAVIGGVISGVFYIGRLEGRLSALENTEQIKEAALLEVSAMKGQALEELSQALELFDGIVVSYMGNAEAIPNGWVICGQDGTTSLVGRFLMGTNDFSKVGGFIGSNGHHHPVNLTSSEEVGGHVTASSEGADNLTSSPNWTHQHRVNGSTASTPHIPPAVQVMFLCRPMKADGEGR